MEGLLILLAVWFIFGPTILAIVALNQVSQLRRELTLLRNQGRQSPPRPVDSLQTPSPAPTPPVSAGSTPTAPAVKPAATPPPPPPPPPHRRPSSSGRKPGLELALGGKAFSFIGIAALLFGIAFFVIYSAKMGWISNSVRVLMGLIGGTILIGLGHKAETKNKNLALLARALTGGGCGLFYFSVYAAFNYYHLNSAFTAIAGLVAAALIALSLAVVYRSQAVALLGVLGGFITPLLIDDPALYRPGFILTYVALLNVPVIVLGLKRNWQPLYNCAFGITLFHGAGWLIHQRSSVPDWRLGIAFFTLYFFQFAALGLIKLSASRSKTSRNIDLLRMVLVSAALIASVWYILHQSGHQDFVGLGLIVVALLHLGLTHLARKRFAEYKYEILALLLGGLTAICFALPAQLDGVWVSLGWALEGMLVVWFASRAQSPTLAAAGITFGLIGIGKSMFYDYTLSSLYEDTRIFINPRFISSIACNAMLAMQGRFLNKLKRQPLAKGLQPVDLMLSLGILGGLAGLFTDTFIHWNPHQTDAWLLTSIALLLTALVFGRLAQTKAFPILTALCTLMLLLLPMKILLIDTLHTAHWYNEHTALILNRYFLLHLALLSLVFWRGFKGPLPDWQLTKQVNIHTVVKGLSIFSAVLLVTLELQRGPWSSDTRNMAVTIWWVLSALAMVAAGLTLRHPYLRFMSIFLFLITIVKVFLVDLADLDDLQRVAAFMVLGIVLLLVSYVYQRIAPRLIEEGLSDEANDPPA